MACLEGFQDQNTTSKQIWNTPSKTVILWLESLKIFWTVYGISSRGAAAFIFLTRMNNLARWWVGTKSCTFYVIESGFLALLYAQLKFAR